nr:hypothetical protein [Tanacetum cinerariifolium]
GSESRPPMLNKENYVPWSSRLLRYAKSRPNGKLIHNSILNGPYVRKMIPEQGDANREITKEVDELKAERLAKIQDPLTLMANSNNPYVCPAPHQDQSSFNQNYLQQPMPNPEDITDSITAMNMALTLIAKAFKLNYSTPTNNNQRISSNPRNMQIAQSGMNMGQDRQMQMVGGNGGNQFRQYAGQNAKNPAGYNDVIENQIGNGNLVATRAEGNAAGQNGNQIRCYNCRGVEKIWRCYVVQERFTSSKPKNFSDVFLLTTLKEMFEKPDVEAQVWKNQRGVHGLAKVKSWILLFLWSAYHNIYNYTDDLACREKISINKIHFG